MNVLGKKCLSIVVFGAEIMKLEKQLMCSYLCILFNIPTSSGRSACGRLATSKKVWYTGSTDRSFNSKCSRQFETKDLEQDAVHYYYYRSLPSIPTRDRYLPSITSSLENIEMPKLPSLGTPSKKSSEKELLLL